MTAAEYIEKNGFPIVPARHSHLVEIGKSPAHCRHAMVTGAEDEDETSSMSLGTTVHNLVYTNFGRLPGGPKVLVYPGKVRNGGEWEKYKAAHEGDHIILGSEMDKAKEMAKAIIANPFARRLIRQRGVIREQTIMFDLFGRACRSTPDLRAGDGSWISEIKTSRSADPERFRWDAIKFAYHVQMAMQREAVRSQGFPAPRKCFAIVVESAPPWPVTVMEFTDEDLDEGMRQLRLWMEKLINCEAAGAWPEYAAAVVKLNLGLAPLGLTYGGEPAPAKRAEKPAPKGKAAAR